MDLDKTCLSIGLVLHFRHHFQHLFAQADGVALLHENHFAVGVGNDEDGTAVVVQMQAFDEVVADGAVV